VTRIRATRVHQFNQRIASSPKDPREAQSTLAPCEILSRCQTERRKTRDSPIVSIGRSGIASTKKSGTSLKSNQSVFRD